MYPTIASIMTPKYRKAAEPSEPTVQLATPDVNITGNAVDSITISHNAISGADRYKIDVSTSETFDSVTTHYHTGTSFQIPNLSEDVHYYIRVRAEDTVNGAPDSEYGFIEGGTGVFPTPPYDLYLIDTYVTSENSNESHVSFGWSEGQNATTYEMRFYNEPWAGEWSYFRGFSPTTTMWSNDSVESGTIVHIQIGLTNEYGTAWSEELVIHVAG